MEFHSTREKELVLTGALAFAGRLSTTSPLDHGIVAREFKALQHLLGVADEQVRETVKPDSFTLRDLVSSYIQTPVDTLQ